MCTCVLVGACACTNNFKVLFSKSERKRHREGER